MQDLLLSGLLWSVLVSAVACHQATFLPKLYRVFPQPRLRLQTQTPHQTGEDSDHQQQFQVRQVPGDGGCMFHAVATCLHFAETNEHFTDFDPEIRKISTRLRELSVKTLQTPECSFVLQTQEQGSSSISSAELLQLVAKQYNTTAEGYCSSMLQAQTWGGGPELMALAHTLQTPIHVYELRTKQFFPLKFYLKRTATFDHVILPSTASTSTDRSSASYHHDGEISKIPVKLSKSPLKILFTDGRFPHLSPWSKEPIEANHFLALFPVQKAAGSGIDIDYRAAKLWASTSSHVKKGKKYFLTNNPFQKWMQKRAKM